MTSLSPESVMPLQTAETNLSLPQKASIDDLTETATVSMENEDDQEEGEDVVMQAETQATISKKRVTNPQRYAPGTQQETSPPSSINKSASTSQRVTEPHSTLTTYRDREITKKTDKKNNDISHCDDYDCSQPHKTYPPEVEAMKKRRKNATETAGIVGGLVGMIALGPFGFVVGGGAALAVRSVGKRRERRARERMAMHRIDEQHRNVKTPILVHQGVLV